MRALIVGLGSIGRRHLANLKRIEPEAQITVWRQHSKAEDRAEVAPEAKGVVYSLEDALATRPELAVIASPAVLHIQTAIELAQNGVHLMIEKPLSDRFEGVDDLLALCRQRNLILLVAYHLRFSKSLRVVRESLLKGDIGRVMSIRAEVGQYLPDWRPASDYRSGVSARRDLGGGVVLELSHELDYVRWLAGEVKEVLAATERVSDLQIDVEDMAEIILRFENGALGSVHMDMIQRAQTRSCRIIGTDGTLTWDGLSNEVRMFSAQSDSWSVLHSADSAPPNDMYVAELGHFVNCVRRRDVSNDSGADGRRVLEIALAAMESSRTRRFVELSAQGSHT